jgi:uncharacterized protein HemX
MDMIDEASEKNSMQLRQELTAALDGIRRHLQTQDESAARIERNLQQLSHLVTGNGTPERGIIVRLDRVENVVSELRSMLRTTVSWFLKPAAGAVGLAAVAGLAMWIARFGLAR